METDTIQASWPAIPQLLSGTFMLVQGFLILIQNPRVSLNRVYFAFEVVVASWILIMGMAYWIRNPELAFVFAKIGFFAVIYIPITTYAFSVYFLGDLKQKPFIYAGFLLTFILSLFINHPLMASGVFTYSWGNYIHLGPLGLIAAAFFALAIPLFFKNLYKKFTLASPKQKRWHSLALLTGTLAFFGIIDFLPAYGVTLPFPPLGYVVTTVFATLLGYFILRHQLADIKLLLGRTIGYALLTAVVFFIYTSVFLVLFPASRNLVDLLLNALLFIAGLYALSFLNQKSQRIIDEIFFKDRVNVGAVISNFTIQLRNLRTPESLLETLFAFITEGLRIQSSYVLFLSADETRWLGWQHNQRYQKNKGRVSIPCSRKLKAFLIQHPESLETFGIMEKEISKSTKMELIELIRSLEGQVALPLVHYSSLVGLLILGKKLHAQNYTANEIKMLNNITIPFVISWENAKLYEDIQQTSKAKSDFLSIASHQLRTPLSHFKWSISLLLEDELGHIKNKKQRKMLHRVYASTENMISLVDQLLDIVRVETETLQQTFQSPFNPLPLLNGAISAQTQIIQERGYVLHYKTSGFLPFIIIPPDYLKAIVNILIENAARYTAPPAAINFTASATKQKELLITVEDKGIGIPEDQQSHVFTRFFRADNAVAAHPTGTGLGLFYAKLLVEKYGGKIWFRSKEGKGTTFYVLFPSSMQRGQNP